MTTPGSGIDTGVLQIAVSYEIRGMIEHITSYNAASDGAWSTTCCGCIMDSGS